MFKCLHFLCTALFVSSSQAQSPPPEGFNFCESFKKWVQPVYGTIPFLSPGCKQTLPRHDCLMSVLNFGRQCYNENIVDMQSCASDLLKDLKKYPSVGLPCFCGGFNRLMRMVTVVEAVVCKGQNDISRIGRESSESNSDPGSCPTGYFGTPPNCKCMEDNMVYMGHNVLVGSDNHQSSRAACQRSCATNPDCQFWTWDKETRTNCYLKSKRDVTLPYDTYVSGSKHCVDALDAKGSVSGFSICGATGSGNRNVDGKEVVTNKYPWIVSLMSLGGPFCGGILVASQYVITAAHCMYFGENLLHPLNIAHLRVKIGDYDLTASAETTIPEKIVSVSKISNHESYDPERKVNDIAVLKLAEEVDLNVYTPACLATNEDESTFYGETVHVYGWGATSWEGPSSNKLIEVDVPVVTPTKCSISMGPMDEGKICAEETCNGDSGGPLTYESSGQHVLAGVVSYGNSCGKEGEYGVYSRISFYRSWIDKHMPDAQFCSMGPNAGFVNQDIYVSVSGVASYVSGKYKFFKTDGSRNTWRRENDGDSNPLTDFYLFFSDRSEGGKRWLIDNAIWYKDPVKRNGNEFSGKVYALQDSVFPSQGNGWMWKSKYGDDPLFQMFIE